jgi:hypothetical protein
MTGPKWTQGPWKTKYDPSTHRIEINDADDWNVAFLHVGAIAFGDTALFTMATQTDCNRKIDQAHLIAAAPDMVEALERINRMASPSPDRTFDQASRDLEFITDIARAAIAKATKETEE